jgi:acetylornithine deacetylase/succinyl-diaminopimelate desuccinylase-like protein
VVPRRRLHAALPAVLVALCLVQAGCTQRDLNILAGDDKAGRQNGTAGSAAAREFLIDELRPVADGLAGGSGDAAYLQPFTGGTNVMAVIPGTDLADEYVMVGAHYDGLGGSCEFRSAGDSICNGATDNATGVAALLAIARALGSESPGPRRSIILAIWDREEDGLLGSRHYVANPLRPLNRTVAYVNFDIVGANLLPSLRGTSVAVAAESGGARLEGIVRSAIDAHALDTEMLSTPFGQGRSDHATLLGAGVPSVFFTDATGGCYHTNDDEPAIVDHPKLLQQIGTSLAVTRALANTGSPPSFVSGTPPATYDDAVAFGRIVNRAWADRALFSSADQATLERVRNDMQRIVDEGRAAFDSNDLSATLGNAATVVSMLTGLPCEGYLQG